MADPRRLDFTVHQDINEYLAGHSPVAPSIEGRAVATDASADLLSQVEGMSFETRSRVRVRVHDRECSLTVLAR